MSRSVLPFLAPSGISSGWLICRNPSYRDAECQARALAGREPRRRVHPPGATCGRLDAGAAAPEQLVELQLEPHRQPVAQDPGCELRRWRARHRREVHRAALVEPALAHEVTRPA